MAYKTKTVLETDNTSDFPTNGSRAITATILRGWNQDILDTLYLGGYDGTTFTADSNFDMNTKNLANVGTITAATINGSGLTASRVLTTDGSKNLATSTVTTTTLGYLDATSSIQTQIDAKAPTASPTFTTAITGSYLTASTVLVSDGSKNLVSSAVTTTTLGYLDATSSIQTQIDAKAPTASPTFTTAITGSYLTASEMLITDASKNIVSAPVATYPSLTQLITLKVATPGTAELSKAVVLDASKAITGLGAVGCGALTATTGTFSDVIARVTSDKGHLQGIATNADVSPIYTIGSIYNPDSTTTLGDMYGIGYTDTTASFLNSTDLGVTPSVSWGMYVASDGNARIFLGGGDGNGYFKGGLYAETGTFRGAVGCGAITSTGDSKFNGGVWIEEQTSDQLIVSYDSTLVNPTPADTTTTRFAEYSHSGITAYASSTANNGLYFGMKGGIATQGIHFQTGTTLTDRLFINQAGAATFAGTLGVTGTTEALVISDSGSTSATEQDWITVTVGGNTGYIRVYATK